MEERLLLDAIAEREQFPVSDVELEAYLRNLDLGSEQTEGLIEALQESESYRAFIRDFVLRKKAYELLEAIARGEEVPEPGQHPVMEAPAVEVEEEVEENAHPTDNK